ncbi:hypothetical protein LguiB_034701 [Lonicera macranthoides]
MEKIALTHIFKPSPVFPFFGPSFSNPIRSPQNLQFSYGNNKRVVVPLASKEDPPPPSPPPNLNSWELMELKFGKLLGEDPQLTMAKVMGKRMNPDMSNLEIEKLFYKKKSKGVKIEEVPFDVPDKVRSSGSPNGLNLVRPVPKKGVKFETSGSKPKVLKVKRPGRPAATAEETRSRVPDVILRKPSMFSEEDVETENSSKLRIKPNFSLKMSKEQAKERFSDLTLIRKPKPVNLNLDKKEEPSDGTKTKVSNDIEENGSKINDVPLLEKPNMNPNLNDDRKEEVLGDYTSSSSGNDATKKGVYQFLETLDFLKDQWKENDSFSGMQTLEQRNDFADSNTRVSVDAALQGKPKRLDQSVKQAPKTSGEVMGLLNPESCDNVSEDENFVGTSEIKEREDADWARAEDLVWTEGREEVELISSSSRGFVVSFGSLVGFLPYRHFSSKWKYLAFESWLRRNNLDPASYKQDLGVIGNYNNSTSKATSLDSALDSKIDNEADVEISPDKKLEDLLKIYEQEKNKFLQSFVGQKIIVNVILADRTSRRLIFSSKPKEKEESIKRKKNLMAKLSVGDVVKCCIKKITYFGIFVEVEGVPALIHQTEVSWDATLDPASYFKIGQFVDAKVHQLDFSLDRIYLSLKELMADPLIESFEAAFADHDSLDGRLQEAQADTEWAEVETLIKELEQFEGIESVSKGRYCLSPGLAPTFQVYMASMFENQYKLLARSENRVQEVMVQTSLSKEEMKSVIQTCTNRVA